VPVDSTFPYYSEVNDTADLPPIVAQQIEHFFTHYKDLEPGKWSKLNGWGGRDVAERLILEAIERAKDAPQE
jgi:inorganic pyrophosphatase